MATSSFDKEFYLNTKKSVESFEKIISSTDKGKKIIFSLVSPEKISRGEQKLKQTLSR